jgi:large subunit ribosomal protein L5e
VKFRRRREGKTDYKARRHLTIQAKNKYNTPKYRLVVRFTNKDVVCQITYAKLKGDVVMTAAYSHELPRYGLSTGLTNYAAAYCTGLLVARRHLKSLGLDDQFKGKEEVTGEDWSYDREKIEGRKPFRCNLDVGLVRTTTGNRVFSAMKGAHDGGLDIPHSDQRFAGWEKAEPVKEVVTKKGKKAPAKEEPAKKEPESKGKLNPEKFRKYLLGGHVADYMKKLKEKDNDAYQRQFSKYIAAGVKPEDLEKLYIKVHAAIRASPERPAKAEKKAGDAKPKRWRKQRKSLAERKGRVFQMKAKAKKRK